MNSQQHRRCTLHECISVLLCLHQPKYPNENPLSDRTKMHIMHHIIWMSSIQCNAMKMKHKFMMQNWKAKFSSQQTFILRAGSFNQEFASNQFCSSPYIMCYGNRSLKKKSNSWLHIYTLHTWDPRDTRSLPTQTLSIYRNIQPGIILNFTFSVCLCVRVDVDVWIDMESSCFTLCRSNKQQEIQ